MRRWGRALAGALGVCLFCLAARGVWSAAPGDMPAARGPEALPAPLSRAQADVGPLYTDEGQIPWYRPADIGGMPAVEGQTMGFTLEEMIQRSDLVLTGRIAGKREGGRVKIDLCTYALIQVETVLKGDRRDWVYVLSSGRPLSTAQCRALSAALPGQMPGLAHHPLSFAPIGARVLLFLRRPSEEILPERDIGVHPIYGLWGGAESCYGLDGGDGFYRLQPLGALPCPPGPVRDRMFHEIGDLSALRRLMTGEEAPSAYTDEGQIPWYSDAQLERLGVLGWREIDGDRWGDRLDSLAARADAVVVGRLTDKRLIDGPQPGTLARIAVERVLKGEAPEVIDTPAVGAPIRAEQLRALQRAGRVGEQSLADPLPYTPIGTRVLLFARRLPDGLWEHPLYVGVFGVGEDGAIRSLALPEELLAQPISPARSELLNQIGDVDALAARLQAPRWIVDGVDLMQVYDRRNPEVPLYNQAQLDALQIGGYASYQLVAFGDSAADMLANFCDTVVIGTIERKQLIENGVPCTLVGVSVEQVLKGDPETLIYVMGTGAPVSQQQAASLESTKEDYDALPYIPIGTRVLLILQRDPDDPFPSEEKAAYTEVGMYNGCYGVDDEGALYPVVHSAGHQRLTRQGGASVYGQMLGALGSVQAVQAALSDPAA